jgi:hypothetical protein
VARGKTALKTLIAGTIATPIFFAMDSSLLLLSTDTLFPIDILFPIDTLQFRRVKRRFGVWSVMVVAAAAKKSRLSGVQVAITSRSFNIIMMIVSLISIQNTPHVTY